MKVRDEALWQLSRAEILSNGELGTEMLRFVEDWTAAAETLLDPEFSEDGSWAGEPADALRQALPGWETRHGIVNVSALAQGLVIVLAVWEYGGSVYQGLTPFERKLVDDVLSLKQLELAKAASDVTG